MQTGQTTFYPALLSEARSVPLSPDCYAGIFCDVNMRQCNLCKKILDYSIFDYKKRYNKDGKPACNVCRNCYNEQRNKYLKTYRAKNKEKIYKSTIKWRKKNKEKVLGYLRSWQENNREKTREISLRYYKNNYDEVRKKRAVRKYHLTLSQNQKISCRLRARIRDAMIRQGQVKSNGTTELIGCSIEFLRSYIENQFKPGMTWHNHGKKGWHIDHIIPCSSFDLSNHDEVLKCFNYKNMQPLWACDNLKKGKSMEWHAKLTPNICEAA